MEDRMVQNRQEVRERRCKVEVEIYGDQYLLAATARPEYMQQLAGEVDARMREASEANPHLGPLRVAMLTLLGLAADVSALQSALDNQQEGLAERCLEIERDIEQLLGVA